MAMKRGLLGVIALAATVGFATSAESQVGLDLREVRSDVLSRRLYHGYVRSDGWSVAPALDFGLAGFALTSTGRWGLSLEVEGGYLLEDRRRHPDSDDLALTLAYERKLGEGGDHRLRFGYRQSFFPDHGPHSPRSEELFARFQPLLSDEKSGFNIRPFVEVSYDFKRYDGSYAALGFDHALSLEKRLHVRSSVKLNGRLAFSDQLAVDPQQSRKFGFHHGRLGLQVPFEHPLTSSTLVFGPSVSWDWAASAVRSTSGFAWGVDLRLVR